jgi:hypothetical protein
MYDFNADGNQPSGRFELLPVGTYRLQLKIRSGGAGPDGVLRLAKNLNTLMLDTELIVVEGPHKGRKLWQLFTVDLNEQQKAAVDQEQWSKYETAVRIGRKRLGAVLNSAYSLRADDDSEEAQEKRRVESLQAFDGLTFYGRVGIRSGNGSYRDQNQLVEVLTPDNWMYPKPAAKAIVPIAEEMDDGIPF